MNETIVAFPEKSSRSDDEIAAAITAVLDSTGAQPSGIHAVVQNGRVALEGTVGFRYQKQAAERTVRRMAGVVTVDNRVVVATNEAAEKFRSAIKAAICRRLDQSVEVDVVYEVG